MNKSKIEWCDYTWNPVTGCLHGCDYCYAERIAKRFETKPEVCVRKVKESHTNDFICYEGIYHCAFPFGFKPTFYKERLTEPQKLKKPSKIFVVSMGDLFGEWVPDEWIHKVLKVVKECPQHTFMFLTKNPKRYKEFKYPDNCWLGATVTCQEDVERYVVDMNNTNHHNRFLSVEPLLSSINLCDVNWRGYLGNFYINLISYDDENHVLNANDYPVKWVIIGAQTGPGAKPPKDEWVQSIIDQCRSAGVPVFVKPPLYEKFPIQEWPEKILCE